jgi:hypothetical protein
MNEMTQWHAAKIALAVARSANARFTRLHAAL